MFRKIFASTKSRYILIASAIAIVLLLLIIIPMFLPKPNAQNNSSDNNGQTTNNDQTTVATPSQIRINNFDQYVRNLSADRRDLIQQNLFNTVRMNLPSDTDLNITDAIIRDGSYSQTYDYNTQIYSTRFIVDIPSIQQSYVVTDKFSPLPPELSGLFDYATLVLCPDEKDLIFKPFNCTDRIRQEQGQ